MSEEPVMSYDIRIINGQVADTQTGSLKQMDLAVKDGKIIEDGSEEAEQTIDARGKYVLPGLIDEHVHINYLNSNIGANADLLCLPMGVTTAVDPGSTGWSNFDGLYYNSMQRFMMHTYAYLHVSPRGVLALDGQPEDADPGDYNEEEILKKVRLYPEIIRGLKIRINRTTLNGRGMFPLKKALDIAAYLEEQTKRHYLLEVHVDDLPEDVSIAQIAGILRPGDIFLHVFQMRGETIFTKDGRVRPEIKEAQRRGVLMDDAHGRALWSFQHLKQAVCDGFIPDIISSDLVHPFEYQRPAFGLLHTMNTDLAAGFDMMDIVKAVTYNPARALGLLPDAGTLAPGSCADICIMDLVPHEDTYYDKWGGFCTVSRVFVPLMTILKGKVVYRQTFF